MEHTQEKLNVGVAYGQICVFHTTLVHPFNDWTETHIAQGFVWRPGSVSFGTLDNCGSCETIVQIRSDVALGRESVRAIQVPFSVPEACPVSVGSPCGSEDEIQIPVGEYRLIYETGLKPYEPPEGEELDEWTAELTEMWCRFTFCPSEEGEAKILRQDELLSPPSPLSMQGRPG